MELKLLEKYLHEGRKEKDAQVTPSLLTFFQRMPKIQRDQNVGAGNETKI